MGELSKLYAIGDIIFLGASLVPLGGQNPVEPALWAKPILSGPSYEDFEEIFVHLLKKGGAIIVRSARELGESFNMLLEEPEKARLMGNNAKEVVLSLKGASQRHASVILRLSPNI
jgi:3-deoxy-D-manno-octulosonic-acid transferase